MTGLQRFVGAVALTIALVLRQGPASVASLRMSGGTSGKSTSSAPTTKPPEKPEKSDKPETSDRRETNEPRKGSDDDEKQTIVPTLPPATSATPTTTAGTTAPNAQLSPPSSTPTVGQPSSPTSSSPVAQAATSLPSSSLITNTTQPSSSPPGTSPPGTSPPGTSPPTSVSRAEPERGPMTAASTTSCKALTLSLRVSASANGIVATTLVTTTTKQKIKVVLLHERRVVFTGSVAGSSEKPGRVVQTLPNYSGEDGITTRITTTSGVACQTSVSI